MSCKAVVASVVVLSTAAYGALSVYVVSASLTAKGTCASSKGPPRHLTVETLEFNGHADETRLAGWLVPTGSDRAVILIHGIDSDAWTGAAPDLATAYVEAGFDVLLFDLRAHGRSGGHRVSLGNLERGDVRAAVNVLLDRGIQPGRVGLHGTSYGAAMALLAAAGIPEIGAVVADSAFADARDLIATEVGRRTHVPGFLAGSLMRPGIETAARMLFGLDLASLAPERAIAEIAPRPLLLIQGSQDPVIPLDHARRLKDHAGNSAAELWILDGMGHTEGVRSGPCNQVPSPGGGRFLERVVSFMDAAMGTVHPLVSGAGRTPQARRPAVEGF